jgi:hypothetical protein
MTMTDWNDPNAFDGIVNHSFQANQQVNPQVTPAQPYTDPSPYGPPAPHHGHPVKTGLTPRGKAALAIAATVVAGGGLLGWQHYAAGQAAAQVKAKELSIEQQKLDIQRLKALGDANQAAQKTQTAQDKTRQKQIDACVQDNKGLVGKQLGATYRSVLDDCQAQYPATASTGDMQEAASASDSASGGGATNILLVGGGALALGAIVFVRKASRPAPPQHYQY